jgi:SAM-dependent methyltransferase/uncharacterized protein YbaR (Trm112 family)
MERMIILLAPTGELTRHCRERSRCNPGTAGEECVIRDRHAVHCLGSLRPFSKLGTVWGPVHFRSRAGGFWNMEIARAVEVIKFVCPKDKQALLRDDKSLGCPLCGASYPILRGIPVLIDDDNSVFAVSDYADDPYGGDDYGRRQDKSSGVRRLYHRVMSKVIHTGIKRTHLDAETAIERIQAEIPHARILIVGCGDSTYEGAAQFVYTDVAFSRNAECICDAADLPFEDGYFDAVIMVAVLEHVADPVRCAEEAWRVLKPSGYIYAATPFLQPVHMGAYDFTRFTLIGHRRLFRKFDQSEIGTVLGPGQVLAWSFQYFLLSLSDNGLYRKVVRAAGLLLTFPLKYLDLLTKGKTGAIDMAGGVFFFGKRREAALPDRQIVTDYLKLRS